jgi:hypothetical protein
MSNLIVTNINGIDAVAGQAKAWALYTGAGVVSASHNISSIVDYGTGRTSTNFTNVMNGNELYSPNTNMQADEVGTNNHGGVTSMISRYDTAYPVMKAGSCGFTQGGETGTFYEPRYVSIQVHGDLA